ncbi:MAG: hypothetical protein P8R48_03580 [Planctomycetota bacterium]|jgi:hypothetical protein|nr:hypothetical protein [Planctomycetota bacterium]
MTFKILSDFDGVWTNPGDEAAGVQALMIAETARLSGIDREIVAGDFKVFGEIALGTPGAHGWAPDGRITAYVDEDPFCLGNSMAGVLGGLASGELPLAGCALGSVDGSLLPRAAVYAGVIAARGFENPSAFADHCFLEATAAFLRDHPPALVPGAKAIAERFLTMGADVVVVSNSGEDKILNWLRDADIPAYSVHDESRPSGEPCFRVRGSAAKFALGDGSESITVSGRDIFVDRPKYHAVLEIENADFVIGDVFSLDLALPHKLREAGESFAPRELVLRRHDYTPEWVAGSRAGGAIDHVVDSLNDLCDLCEARLS